VAKIRHLYKEVGSLAALLSSGMEALKTSIAATVAAADAVSSKQCLSVTVTVFMFITDT
jgi:hypothetical protein